MSSTASSTSEPLAKKQRVAALENASNSLRLADRCLAQAIELQVLDFVRYDELRALVVLSKSILRLVKHFLRNAQQLRGLNLSFVLGTTSIIERQRLPPLRLCTRLKSLILPNMAHSSGSTPHVDWRRDLLVRVIHRNCATLEHVRLPDPPVPCLQLIAALANCHRLTELGEMRCGKGRQPFTIYSSPTL